MHEPETAAPVRRDHSRRITQGVMIVVAAVVVGFVAGRITAPERDGAATGCTQVNRTATESMSRTNGTDVASAEWVTNVRVTSNLILQNPSCFPAETRAQAQTALDQLALNQQSQDMNALRESTCKAAGKGWWC